MLTACREILELMSTALDHPLSPDEQARLDNHLAECPDCKAAQREFQWTHSRIKELEAVEPPPWLISKTMARIRAEAVPQASFWRRFILPIVLKPQLQVASILLLAATGFYLLRSQRPGQEVFDAMKERQAPATVQSEASKSGEAAGKLTAEGSNSPKEARKSRSEAVELSLAPDSKSMEPGFAQPPPKPSASMIPAVAKQERDAAIPGPPAAVPPPAPSVLAGASVGASVAVVAESEAAPARQAKKTSKGATEPVPADRANRADERTREKTAEATGQLLDQTERKDKSDSATWVIRMEMADPRSARPLLERELTRSGATLMPQGDSNPPRVLYARLDPRHLPDLLSRLARIGKVLEQPVIPAERPSLVTISISW